MDRIVDSPVDVTLTVQAPSGSPRDVVVSPGAQSALASLRADLQAPSGPVSGHPSVYYLNTDGAQMPDLATLTARISESQAFTGMVVDLRGSPALQPYDIATSLVPDEFDSAVFHIPVMLGPVPATPVEISFKNQPVTNPYSGKIAVLVDPRTLASGEALAMALVDAGRTVAVVGRTSAGTSGDFTAVQLPGHFAFQFTGMEVLHADKSAFEGVGVVPTVEVAPTADDLAAGNDVALQAAITQVE
jgi:hypothetical protein